jgi:hypothetical protein
MGLLYERTFCCGKGLSVVLTTSSKITLSIILNEAYLSGRFEMQPLIGLFLCYCELQAVPQIELCRIEGSTPETVIEPNRQKELIQKQ